MNDLTRYDHTIRLRVVTDDKENEMRRHLRNRIRRLPAATEAVRFSMLAFVASVVVTR